MLDLIRQSGLVRGGGRCGLPRGRQPKNLLEIWYWTAYRGGKTSFRSDRVERNWTHASVLFVAQPLAGAGLFRHVPSADL